MDLGPLTWAVNCNHGLSLFDNARHLDTLAILTSELLSGGRPDLAFPFADRSCRLVKAGARSYLLRAEASRFTGFADYAELDLAAAIDVDPNDPLVNIAALSWGPSAGRAVAARRALEGDDQSDPLIKMAIEFLLDEGEAIVCRVSRLGDGWIGWAAWRGVARIDMICTEDPSRSRYRLSPDSEHPLAAASYFVSGFGHPAATGKRVVFEFSMGGEVVRRTEIPASIRGVKPALDEDLAEATTPNTTLSVIVPIYEDIEATRACVESLIVQRARESIQILFVDDASPNEGLRVYVEEAARKLRCRVIRNPSNLGFAGAVNAALRFCPTGDVLLLNADTILPPGALDRLVRVAHSAPNIGTITPLSNNGEFTSYPVKNVANPLPNAEGVALWDRRAREANGDSLVDLPNGIGFCLYITRACIDAVGGLSESYLQGYYEDVEFCLRAHERGFRNVCASGIFVGHAGSRSFGSRKRALVARNLKLLELRFPEHQADCTAFLERDPLQEARAELDRRATPEGEVVLIVCGPGAARLQARARAEDISPDGAGNATILCAAGSSPDEISLTRHGGGTPQELRFDLVSDLDELRAYINRLDVSRVEVFDAPGVPESVLNTAFAIGARVDLVCADFEWFGRLRAPFTGACSSIGQRGACVECGTSFAPKSDRSDEDERTRNRLSLALSSADTIMPLDRMGDAFARRIFKAKAATLRPAAHHERPQHQPPSGSAPVIGVLFPTPMASADDLVLKLSRRLIRVELALKIVVLGSGIDDLALMASGNVFVTGKIETREYQRLVEQYGVTTMVLAHRTTFFGEFERVAKFAPASMAYFDWSFGALACDSGDLALDPRICNDKAAHAIAAWLESQYRDPSK